MCSVLRSLLVVAGILGASFSAKALEYEDRETSDGIRFLLISERFEPSENLEPFAIAVARHKPEVVTFNSGGGSVDTAMRLGRMIRAFGLNSIQIRNMECASACALAFLGGVNRAAMSGALGVHRTSFTGGINLSAADAVAEVQAITADVMSYIAEMGADPALMQLALQYDASDMRYLSSSEMRQYRMINGGDSSAEASSARAAPPRSPPAQPPVASLPRPNTNALRFTVPVARNGWVRHPKGAVFLRSEPGENGKNLVQFRNRSPVRILESSGRWYRVQTSRGVGYMHDTWVLVEQFDSGGFEDRHIQIKSFDNYPDAERYVRASPVPLTAYLSTNGWFAITLAETFEAGIGAALLKELKAKKLVPDDSYMSYGNTYARKVCCD